MSPLHIITSSGFPPPVLNPALARERLQEVVTQVREGTFPYRPRTPAFLSWPLYDRAQTHEAGDLLALLVRATETLVERVPSWGEPPIPSRGRPRVSTVDRLRVLLWQSYRGIANRPMASEARLQARSLGLARPFSYGTVWPTPTTIPRCWRPCGACSG